MAYLSGIRYNGFCIKAEEKDRWGFDVKDGDNPHGNILQANKRIEE